MDNIYKFLFPQLYIFNIKIIKNPYYFIPISIIFLPITLFNIILFIGFYFLIFIYIFLRSFLKKIF